MQIQESEVLHLEKRPKSKRSENISQPLDAVEAIIVTLRDKHDCRFSVEKPAGAAYRKVDIL